MKIAAKIVAAGLLLSVLGAAAALVMLQPRVAHAQAFTYSTTRRTFKVGNLMISSTTIDDRTNANPSGTEYLKGPENTAPYAFFIADARTDLKPLNWEFVNPLAPKLVTSSIQRRWNARDANRPYQIGQNVTKNMAAYWEVFLNEASVEDLIQFDLLFITGHRDLRFTPAEREKLRKVVDAGGIVWIEDSGGLRIRRRAEFFLDLQFRTLPGGSGGPVINSPSHPLLTSPYRLTYPEIANLGDKNYGGQYLSALTDADEPPINQNVNRGNQGSVPPEADVLVNIIGNSAAPTFNGFKLPYIAAGIYGSGSVIASAADVGDDINNYAGGSLPANRGAYSGENIQTAHAEDLKFLYNMVAWGSASNTERRNSRRTAAAFESVGAPLVNLFNFTNPGTPPGSIVASRSAPVVHKGILLVTGIVEGEPVLAAYDTQTYRDIDGNGNPDDGVPDLLLGAPYDEIWRAPLTGGAAVHPSSPTVASVNTSAGAVEAVFVTQADGALVGYRVFPATNGVIDPTPSSVLNNANPGGGTPYDGTVLVDTPGGVPLAPSPVFFEGRLHVVQPDGRIRCVSPSSGATLWLSQDAVTTTAAPTGSPTLGFTRLVSGPVAANSGGSTLDLMLYQPVREPAPPGGGSGNIGRVLPFFLGARNEVVTRPVPGQALALYNTRVYADPGQERYYVARPSDDPAFIEPIVRVYAAGPRDGVLRSARENYEAGFVSNDFIGTFQPVQSGAAGATGGRVRVTPIGSATLPSPLPPDYFIVAVDYDLLYHTDKYGRPPGQPQDASRDPLKVARINNFSRGLNTAALSPGDLLIFSAQQSEGGTPLTSVFALREQSGNNAGGTRLPWRFGLHETAVARAGTGGTVSDPPALQNLVPFTGRYTANSAEVPAGAAGVSEALQNVTSIGAPIVTNENVTYVLAAATRGANGPPVSVLMAFRTDQDYVLNVGPLTPNSPVIITQFNPLTQVEETIPANQYTVDAARGRVTINNFQPGLGAGGGGGVGVQGNASASQSFAVTVTPAGQSAPTTQVHAPLGSDFGDDFTPLLWYYVLPGIPQSPPTLVGSFIYFTVGADGGMHLLAVDADPAANDPAVRRGQQVINVTGGERNHLRWAQRLAGLNDSAVTASGSPVGGQGVLAVNTNRGTFVFEDALTLIAEGRRVVEANADGSVVWTLDSTTRRTVAGGELPRFDENGNVTNNNVPNAGRINEERRPISRPSTVRRLGPGDLLIADTGNNRVVRVDRSGRVLWNLERINDAYRILASGDPETLNTPTDVQLWTNVTYDANGTPDGYEVHYLIADAGNFRLIEVADYFDTNGRVRLLNTPGGQVRGQHILVWSTRTLSREGRRLRYQSVQRFVSSVGNVNGVPFIVAVVGNTRAAGADTGATTDFTGGAVVRVHYRPFNPRNATLNPLRNPWPVGGTEPLDNGLIADAVDDLVLPNPDGSVRAVKRITRPLYFQQITVSGANPALPGSSPIAGQRLILLICDAEGVFEVEPRVVNGRVVRYVTWSFTPADYNRMNTQVSASGTGPRIFGGQGDLPGFVPTSVRRLPSGNYLITNAFTGGSGLFQNRQFLGEVFEVERDKNFAGFSVPQIVPGNTGTLNQQRMGATNNTSLLEQPLFADRL